MAKTISSDLIQITKVTELPDLALALTNVFAHCGLDGILGKVNINGLVNFITPYISAAGSSSFLPTIGSVLPSTSATSAYTFVGSGTYTQASGGNIITTSPLTILYRDSTTWSLGVALPVGDFLATSDVVYGSGKNIFDKSSMFVNGFYIGNGGSKVVSSGDIIARIPVKAGVYTINKIQPNLSLSQFLIEDSSGTNISNGLLSNNTASADGSGKIVNITVDGFFYFTIKLGSSVIDVNTLQMELGNTVTAYESYVGGIVSIKGSKLIGVKDQEALTIDDFTFGNGTNVFDKDTMVVNGAYISTTGDIIPDSSSAYISVPVIPGSYAINKYPGTGYDTYRVSNNAGLLISNGFVSSLPADTLALGRVVSITQAGFFMMSVSVTTPKVDPATIQIQKGNTVTAYESYQSYIASIKDIELSATTGSSISVKNKSANRFLSKKYYYFGDSLTDGGNEGSYRPYTTAILGCVETNYGSGGSTTGRLVSQATNQPDRQDSFVTVNPDYTGVSAVSIMIGTNGGVSGSISDIPTQSIQNIPYGTITTEDKYWQSFPNTFYGNLGLVIEYIKNKNSETIIYLISPPWNAIDNYGQSQLVRNALLELANFYSIRFIDALYECGIEKKQLSKYSYDLTHMRALGNELLGNYIGFKILNS